MATPTPDRRSAWTSIFLYLAIVTAMSAAFHFALVRIQPSSFYVGALMWCPAIAAFLTLFLTGRRLGDLPWRWGAARFHWGAWLVPVLYVGGAYALIWGLGLGGVPNPETLAQWAGETGLSGLSPAALIAASIALIGTVSFIRAMATIVGEEIGWRGFLIFEMRKVMPFGATALASGLIWAFWHWPIVVFYGGGDPWIQMTAFTVTITAMSVVMTYFTFKANSLWPAVIFHASHNIYAQKVFDPLTVETARSAPWTGEFGIMIPLVAIPIAFWFWRRAKAEGL